MFEILCVDILQLEIFLQVFSEEIIFWIHVKPIMSCLCPRLPRKFCCWFFSQSSSWFSSLDQQIIWWVKAIMFSIGIFVTVLKLKSLIVSFQFLNSMETHIEFFTSQNMISNLKPLISKSCLDMFSSLQVEVICFVPIINIWEHSSDFLKSIFFFSFFH